MKNQKITLIGLILPSLPVGAFISLVLLSFTINNTISSIIAVDKLILLTVGLAPVIYILGAIVSIIALFKSAMKMAPFIALALNIALLIVLLCFSKPIFIEFEFVI